MSDEPIPQENSGLSISHYDLVIVGGGASGCALALLLAPLNWRILLVEAQSRQEGGASADFDERAIALSCGSQQLLQRLGVWPSLSGSAAAIAHIHVSDRGNFGRSELHADEHQVSALGQVIPLRALNAGLYAAVGARTATEVRAECKVESMNVHDDGVELLLQSRSSEALEHCRVRTRWLVAADGTQSGLRQQAGIPVDSADYGQTALVANVATDRAVSDWAYERFTGSGPIALLPLPSGSWSLVWSLDKLEAERIGRQSDAEFLSSLQAAFGWRIGRFVRVGTRNSFPLQRIRSAWRRQGRLLLMGNAAMQLHPIAGQGFNLALRDVADFAAACQANGQLDNAMLEAFLASRQIDSGSTTLITDSLVKLFSNEFAPLATTRALALAALQLCPPARQMIAQLAMGGRYHR